MALTNGPYIGYVGFVRFVTGDSSLNLVVRANSADVALSQEISTEDVVDSRWDRTLYRVGPKIVGGNVTFPGIYTVGSITPTTDIMKKIYTRAVRRNHVADNDQPFILWASDIDIKYTNGDFFTYKKCIIDSWQFSVEQQGNVGITLGIIGSNREREPSFDGGRAAFLDETAVPQTRIITWNDAYLRLGIDSSGDGNLTYFPDDWDDQSEYRIRSYEVNVANNADRFYAIGKLEPSYIYPQKREVNGSISILGRHALLGETAYDNYTYCRSQSTLEFGYEIEQAEGCGGPFKVTLPNVVWQIESMSLSNDIFETTVEWMSLPAGGQIDSGSGTHPSQGSIADYYDPIDWWDGTHGESYVSVD